MSGQFLLPSIYPITDTSISGVSHAEQARLFIAAGAQIIQLRDKRASAASLYDAARAVLDLAGRAGVRVIINDRVDVAIAAGADGVHLGQDDLPPFEARMLLGPDAIIGYSTHSVAQAIAAAQLPVDYIAIGPVFATSSKENPDPPVGIDGVRNVRHAVGNFPLVAIGGINEENISEIWAAGADSAAVIRFLLETPSEIDHRFKRLTEMIDREPC